jgi:dihydroneopterin aldolase
MNYIELKHMAFHAYHGVAEQERIVGNTYIVDLRFGLDLRPAGLSDNLEDTVNYATVYAAVRAEMEIPSRLIEHVAARIVARLHRDFPTIGPIQLRLAKRNPPFGGDIREVAVGIWEEEGTL